MFEMRYIYVKIKVMREKKNTILWEKIADRVVGTSFYVTRNVVAISEEIGVGEGRTIHLSPPI